MTAAEEGGVEREVLNVCQIFFFLGGGKCDGEWRGWGLGGKGVGLRGL